MEIHSVNLSEQAIGSQEFSNQIDKIDNQISIQPQNN